MHITDFLQGDADDIIMWLKASEKWSSGKKEDYKTAIEPPKMSKFVVGGMLAKDILPDLITHKKPTHGHVVILANGDKDGLPLAYRGRLTTNKKATNAGMENTKITYSFTHIKEKIDFLNEEYFIYKFSVFIPTFNTPEILYPQTKRVFFWPKITAYLKPPIQFYS